LPIIAVRIHEARREVVMKHMELGADGILMPNADNIEDVKNGIIPQCLAV